MHVSPPPPPPPPLFLFEAAVGSMLSDPALPNITSASHVCTGLVVGKKFRFVEWDLGISPKEPNGDMIAVQVRTGTITRQGMREAICKAYDLPNLKVVKQFAHVVELHNRTFYEHMDTRESLQNLDEGAVIVWTQVRHTFA